MPTAPAVSADVRRQNSALVFQEILEQGTCSRAHLRKTTGLANASIATIINELSERGLIREFTESATRAGRPRSQIELLPSRLVGATTLLTHDKIEARLTNLTGETIWQDTTLLTPQDTETDSLLNKLAATLDAAQLAAKRIPNAEFIGSAVTVQGPVVNDAFVLVVFGLPLNHLNLQTALQDRLQQPHPVWIFNDGRMGAVAEYFAITPTERPTVMAYVSSRVDGVAGGLIEAGHIYGGEHGLAGEIGHVITNAHGIRCACGARGCLETVLTTRRLLARAGALDWPQAPIEDLQVSQMLLEKLRAKDPTALAALADGGTELAAAIATLSTLTDIGTVVLGGDLSVFSEWLTPEIEHVISEKRKASPIFAPTVRPAALGHEAVAIGTWRTMRDRACADPLTIASL